MKVTQPIFLLGGVRTAMTEYEGSRTGDGRPGEDDPRRYARLHIAAILASRSRLSRSSFFFLAASSCSCFIESIFLALDLPAPKEMLLVIMRASPDRLAMYC